MTISALKRRFRRLADDRGCRDVADNRGIWASAMTRRLLTGRHEETFA